MKGSVLIGGVLSKKFEQISPKICRAGGIPPKPLPFCPPAWASPDFFAGLKFKGWWVG